MVSTRGARSKSALPAMDDANYQPPPNTTTQSRKRGRKAPASTDTAEPSSIQANKRGGLRSNKESPYKILEDPIRKRITRKERTAELHHQAKQVVKEEVDQAESTKDLDPDHGLYFQRAALETDVKEKTIITEDSAIVAGSVVQEPVVDSKPVVENPVVESKPIVEELAVESNPIVEESAVKSEPMADQSSFDNTLPVDYKKKFPVEYLVMKKFNFLSSQLSTTKAQLVSIQSQLVDTQATLADTQATLFDTQASLTDTQATLADTQATLTDTRDKLTSTKIELATTKTELEIACTKANYFHSENNMLRTHFPQLKSVTASRKAYELLERIENARDEHHRREAGTIPVEEVLSQDESDDTNDEMDDTNDPSITTETTPHTPVAQDNKSRTIGQTVGLGLKWFFLSPFTTTTPLAAAPVIAPATAPPAASQLFAAALAPPPSTPTPASASTSNSRRRADKVHHAKGNNKTKKSSKRNRNTDTPKRKTPLQDMGTFDRTNTGTKNHMKNRLVGDRRAMIALVARSVPPEIRDKATAWAKETAEILSSTSQNILGENRKRLEAGILYADLSEIPARYPWQPEGCISGDFLDYDDDEVAPAWLAMLQLVREMDSPPAKKQKLHHDVVMDSEVIPLNDTPAPVLQQSSSSRPQFDSQGNSASLSDLHPRSSRIPSPMFDEPQIRKNSNVFSKPEQSSSNMDANAVAAAKAAREAKLDAEWERKELLKTQDQKRMSSIELHRALVAEQAEKERKAAEEEEEEAKEAAKQAPGDAVPLWTQQPPPAPTPAHASLPAPLTTSPDVPSIQVDPVERQRAKLMKHTPARPSRLREATVPSPSVKSDAGTNSFSFEIPDAVSLDLPADILAAAETRLASPTFQAEQKKKYGGADVTLLYDEEEL